MSDELQLAGCYASPVEYGTSEHARYGGIRLRRDFHGDVWDAVHELNQAHRSLSDAYLARLAADEADLHAGEQMRALYRSVTGNELTSHMRDAGTVIGAFIESAKKRLAADEAERELAAKVRGEWMRRLGQTDTEAPVGTLADECGQLMAMLAIERKADEAKRAERFGATERLTAWIRDYGHEKQPAFIADLRVVLGIKTEETT